MSQTQILTCNWNSGDSCNSRLCSLETTPPRRLSPVRFLSQTLNQWWVPSPLETASTTNAHCSLLREFRFFACFENEPRQVSGQNSCFSASPVACFYGEAYKLLPCLLFSVEHHSILIQTFVLKSM
ncbi:hypothetical protein Bca4012_026456 [Brassica carinata]